MSVIEDLTGATAKRDAAQAESDAIKNAPIEERQRLIDEQTRSRMLERNQRGAGIKPISAGAASLLSPSPGFVNTHKPNPVGPDWLKQRFAPAKTLLGQ